MTDLPWLLPEIDGEGTPDRTAYRLSSSHSTLSTPLRRRREASGSVTRESERR